MSHHPNQIVPPGIYESKGGKGSVAKRLSGDSGHIGTSQIDLDCLPGELGLDLPSDGTYSELTNGQVLHLQSYMHQQGCDLCQVAKDGKCLFNAVRWCVVISFLYFKSHHLWQQIVQFAIEGQYFLVPAVMPQIQGLYRNGDFFFSVTFKEYLQYMLEDGV